MLYCGIIHITALANAVPTVNYSPKLFMEVAIAFLELRAWLLLTLLPVLCIEIRL
jgi:hypothetical protein